MKKLSTLAAGFLGCSLILGVLAATAVRSTALSTSTAETPDAGTVSEELVSQDRALLASAGAAVDAGAAVEEEEPASEKPSTNTTPEASTASTSAGGYKQVLQPGEGWKEFLDPKMLPEPIAELTEVILPRSGPIIPGAEFIPGGETKEAVKAPSSTSVKEVLNEPNPANMAGPVVSPFSL